MPLHDFNIYKYEILSSESKIVFHVKYDFEPKMVGSAIFEGVQGHHFEHSLEGNIILDIEEVEDNSAFYNENKNELQRYCEYGLPLNTISSELFSSELMNKNLKAFEIYSSYGLSGWVIANSCTTEAHENK